MATSADRAACRPFAYRQQRASHQKTSIYLKTGDTDTNMCRLDHADVIRTITNSQKQRLLVFLDKLNDQGLLQR